MMTYSAAINILLTFGTVSASSYTSLKERLIGYPLRSVVYSYPPAMEVVKQGDNNVTYVGFGVDLMEMLVEHFKMDLILIHANDSEVSRVGFNTALYSLIVNKEADLVCYPFQRVMKYADFIEYSYPMSIVPYTFLQAWPKEENTRITALIRPFTPLVWWFFLISTVGLVITLGTAQFVLQKTMIDHSERNEPTVWWHINRSSEYIVSIIFNQGSTYRPSTSRASLYIIVGLWLMSLIVLMNAYTGTLTAFLTVPKLKPTISTIEELEASSNERMLAVEPDTDFYYKCMSATQGPFKVIGDTLRNNPDHALVDGSFANIFDKILNRGCVYPTVEIYAEYVVHADYKMTGQCRMTTAAKSLKYFGHLALPMRKGALFIDAINQGFMLRLWEGGIMESWNRFYLAPLPKCHAETAPRDTKLSAIKFFDFQGIFLVLGMGVGVSCIIFCFELLWSYVVSRHLRCRAS